MEDYVSKVDTYSDVQHGRYSQHKGRFRMRPADAWGNVPAL